MKQNETQKLEQFQQAPEKKLGHNLCHTGGEKGKRGEEKGRRRGKKSKGENEKSRDYTILRYSWQGDPFCEPFYERHPATK